MTSRVQGRAGKAPRSERQIAALAALAKKRLGPSFDSIAKARKFLRGL